jgi:hypothetical protein
MLIVNLIPNSILPFIVSKDLGIRLPADTWSEDRYLSICLMKSPIVDVTQTVENFCRDRTFMFLYSKLKLL